MRTPANGWTDNSTGEVTIYQGAVMTPKGQKYEGGNEITRKSFTVDLAELTPMEHAIWVLAHENHHYVNRGRKFREEIDFEQYADDAGYRALQLYRRQREMLLRQ